MDPGFPVGDEQDQGCIKYMGCWGLAAEPGVAFLELLSTRSFGNGEDLPGRELLLVLRYLHGRSSGAKKEGKQMQKELSLEMLS